MPKPGSPTNQGSNDLASRIVEVATRTLLDRGYAGTTIDELVAVLGASKRSIYSRFVTKDELDRAVTACYAGQALNGLPSATSDDRSAEDRLQHRWCGNSPSRHNSGAPHFTDDIFAPVAAVTVFEKDEDAGALANDTEYGLSAAIGERLNVGTSTTLPSTTRWSTPSAAFRQRSQHWRPRQLGGIHAMAMGDGQGRSPSYPL